MRDRIRKVLDEAKKRRVDFADIRVRCSSSNQITSEDRRANKISSGNSQGAGIRVLLNGAWGLSSNVSLGEDALMKSLSDAIDMAKATGRGRADKVSVTAVAPVEDRVATPVAKDPKTVPVADKMKMLETFENEGIANGDGKVVNSILSYSDSSSQMTIANTFGTYIEMLPRRVSLTGVFIVSDGTRTQSWIERRAGQGGFEFVENVLPEDFSVHAVKKALALLKADNAPSGTFPVVFDPSITGLLLHEALGHNLEADIIKTRHSILDMPPGTKIVSDCVSVIDDSTLQDSYGSYAYDSEGVKAQRNVLIEKGVLKGYLHSLETAAHFGVAPTGNGRAEGYHSRPIPRMSNTFMEPGTESLENMLKVMGNGLYLKRGHWGYVLSERGSFTCHAEEGYVVENGKISKHIRDISISGRILDVLQDIMMVSKDFELNVPGLCGKEGQSVPVNTGGPYTLIKKLVIGGAA